LPIYELLMREDRVAMSRRSKPGKTDKQRKSDVQAETHSRVMLESCGRVPGNRSWSADSGQRTAVSGQRSPVKAVCALPQQHGRVGQDQRHRNRRNGKDRAKCTQQPEFSAVQAHSPLYLDVSPRSGSAGEEVVIA